MHESRRVRIILSILLLAILSGAGATAYALRYAHLDLAGLFHKISQPITTNNPGLYRVVEFADGDTIAVDMDGVTERVRFIGVDTPETQDPRKGVQCFGKAASAFTRNFIGNQRVRLEMDPTNSNRDRYDRLLRYVFTPDGTLVNKEIIAQGYGFAYTDFPFQKMDEFTRAQRTAREQNRGLWGSCQVGGTESRPQTNETP
jgi:micrococcal nuclease